MPYQCSCCGAEVPRSYYVPAPDVWSSPNKSEGSVLEEELCVVVARGGREHFFIRGNLEIPIQGEKVGFAYTAWVSLSATNFQRAIDLWEEPSRVDEPPYFGWFSNRLPGYPDTLNLKTLIHTRGVGRRPSIQLEPTDHPLAREQRDGIPPHRMVEIARAHLGDAAP